VININAENGVAFYSDGNANNRIINKGQVILGEGVPDSADNTDDLASMVLEGTLSGITSITSSGWVESGTVATNTGTLEGPGNIDVNGTLENQSGASITAALNIANGTLTNAGDISSTILATGTSTLNNSGTVDNGVKLRDSSRMTNTGTVTLGSAADAGNASMMEMKNNAVFENSSTGTLLVDNNKNAIHLNDNSTLKNSGTMVVSDSSHAGGVNLYGGTTKFINDGTATVSGGKSLVVSSGNAAAGKSWFWNQDDGVVDFTATTSGLAAVNLGGSNYVGINDGEMDIHGNNAVGMKAGKNSQLVNNGTINLGEEGNAAGESGLIAMQLNADATADAVMENNGTINIYADNSYAFDRMGANGRIINNGAVNIEGTGSGLVKGGEGSVEGLNGDNGDSTEVHAATTDRPVDPTATASVSTDPVRTSVSYYTVGTNANGTAGTMAGNNMDLDDVKVDTGFTAGTAATTETFDNVFVGNDIQGEQNVQSTSVVWTATGSKDANGNVDVTMSKNAYTSVVDDSSVNSVAAALDAGYTNNELYNSLNMATSSDVTKAMKQISGSQALNVARDARVLSNRFDMLADAAPEINNGLSFNVVAKGDPRAELSNDTQYDMMALRQKLGFGNNQSLTMEYGIARLDGDGNVSAGQDGITGGYSQFFGLDHAMPIGESGLSWNNGLRYDVHQLDSKRGINYGDVNKQASADTKQQYLELRSEGRKTFNLSEGLDIASYAGVKLRHTLDDGYKETGAGDFNLNMNSTTETAVDSVVGMKLSYAGKNGWAATATVEGGPNLSYSTSGKTASLQGASGQNFAVDDGQKGGGINSMAQVGVKYHAGNTAASLEAFHWKEDGISDKGLMVNYKFNF
uniref:autotransporter outer membrane beta-barrel domain-containing protein n=1 Tax=Enterobacterales TaxID=91347 RepID=UPI002ED9C13E